MSHFSKSDDTMHEIKKITEDKCIATNTKTNDILSVILKKIENEETVNMKYDAKAKILKDHIYRKRRPVIIGVQVLHGTLNKYHRIFAIKDEDKFDLGMISGSQNNGKEIKTAIHGISICIKLDNDHSYGRQFDDDCILIVQSRKKLTNNEKSKISIPTQIIPKDKEFNTYPAVTMNKLSHALKLKSVYHCVYGKEPMTTNHTKGFSGCLDYLFVSHDIQITHCDKIAILKDNENTNMMLMLALHEYENLLA